MKNLYISELLILSQKEKKAKRVKFDRKRTLIHGKNHTGKSSLIKSIYRTFGAEPLLNPKFKNANASSLIKFKVNEVGYEILRDDKQFAIFDSSGDLIKKFTSVTNELGPYLGNLLDFTPLFQSKSGNFIIPPPAFLFLPYYVDQDVSWAKSWSSFGSLQQIKDYRNQSIFYHSGIRPNEYYSTKQELQEYLITLEETKKEQKITTKILTDINNKLLQANFNIDVEAFKDEIAELLIEAQLLKQKEEKLKSNLYDLYHLQATYETQIEIVKRAIIESNNDLKFATENLPDVIGCPTCGAEYENSFAERFEIAKDERKSKDLLLDLNRDLKEIQEKITKEKDTLNNTTVEVTKINKILEQKKEEVQLKDVIDNSGRNQVRNLFKERKEELKEIIMHNAFEIDKLEKKLKSFEKKERKEIIVDFYRSTMASFLRKLDVHSLNEDEYKSISTIIENKETGSSRPRALIAYYFTFFHLMKKYSSTVYCPLILDSPNQQDQDIEHIDKIMQFINKNQPEESQMILGLAETYDVDFNCKEIRLTETYSLLQKNEYNDVSDEMLPKLEEMWFTK